MNPDPADRILDAFSWRAIHADLKLVSSWLVLAVLGIYLPPLDAGPLRVVLALPVVLFIPGYTLVAALFPGKEEIDGIERLALSFGLSIAVSPLIGLLLNYTPWGIRLDPIVVSLVAFSAVMTVAAQYRRSLLPTEKRFTVPFRESAESVKTAFAPEAGSRIDRVLSTVLIVSVVAAVSATVYVIAVPKEGERFTEFYILGEKGKAADYPAGLVAGQPAEILVGIGNHEYRDVTYTAETWMTNTTFDPAANATVTDRMELVDRFTVTLAQNGTYREARTFTPPGTGYNQVTFLLFADQAPPDSLTGTGRIAAAYRELHLWVTVRQPSP
ncbi:MAG: DUF1616 domain-containing protein [Methanoregulaceae archaeon]|nr:DUF1616 domain-containing protein [Methanoregulaceae archaeon]